MSIEQRSRFSKIRVRSIAAELVGPHSTSWPRSIPACFVKNGRSTLCNLDILDRILDGLPVAEIKAPRKPSATP